MGLVNTLQEYFIIFFDDINKREVLCYTIFTKNHRWRVVIDSDLNSKLELIFPPSVTTNNNLPLKICCESMDIAFLLVNIELL